MAVSRLLRMAHDRQRYMFVNITATSIFFVARTCFCSKPKDQCIYIYPPFHSGEGYARCPTQQHRLSEVAQEKPQLQQEHGTALEHVYFK